MTFSAIITDVTSLDVSFDPQSEVLPEDYFSFVPKRGDHTRDSVTKGFFYLAGKASFAPQDFIVVASEYGNASALADFHAACMHVNGALPSAVQFASATTSTTATSLNILHGVTGGNLTINAGARTLESGLVTALSLLADKKTGISVHLFFGDVRTATDQETRKHANLYYLRLDTVADASSTILDAEMNTIDDAATFLAQCQKCGAGSTISYRPSQADQHIIYRNVSRMVA